MNICLLEGECLLNLLHLDQERYCLLSQEPKNFSSRAATTTVFYHAHQDATILNAQELNDIQSRYFVGSVCGRDGIARGRGGLLIRAAVPLMCQGRLFRVEYLREHTLYANEEGSPSALASTPSVRVQ